MSLLYPSDENRIEIAKLRVTVLMIAPATVTVASADDGACGTGSYLSGSCLSGGVCLRRRPPGSAQSAAASSSPPPPGGA